MSVIARVYQQDDIGPLRIIESVIRTSFFIAIQSSLIFPSAIVSGQMSLVVRGELTAFDGRLRGDKNAVLKAITRRVQIQKRRRQATIIHSRPSSAPDSFACTRRVEWK